MPALLPCLVRSVLRKHLLSYRQASPVTPSSELRIGGSLMRDLAKQQCVLCLRNWDCSRKRKPHGGLESISHFISQFSPQPTLLRRPEFITLIKADVQTVLQTNLSTIFIFISSTKSVSPFKKNMSAVNGHNFVYWFRKEVLLLCIKLALSRLKSNYSKRRISG